MTLSWTNIQVRLGDLRAWSDNPRLSTKKQAERLLKSFDEFGQVQTIAVSPDLDVYDGHQRLSALLTIHGKDYIVDARQSSRALTDEERRKLVIYLHSGAVGSWDWDALSGWNAQEVIGWGMDDGQLRSLKMDVLALTTLLEVEKPPDKDAETQFDIAEELMIKWGVENGQTWILGDHRVVCGDCTDVGTIEQLLENKIADLGITDPPYNYDFDYGVAKDNLSIEEYESFVRKWWSLSRKNSKRMVVTPGLKNLNFYYRNFDITWTCAWIKKNAMTASKIGNLSVWEPILFSSDDWDWEPVIIFGRTNKKVKRDVYDFPIKVQQNTGGHPCPKLLEFWEKLIIDFSSKDDVVFDGFLGSGTTLIACENLGRKCRAIEISPAYVAVALQRWADLTGKTPELIGTAE